ncbi:14581_t:CDS:2 [Funneliformis geosporum]|uniref:Glucosamine 6-phosphate N-acetyltransferase n=1 Tax=Funneliformis geosporum TaxID=1117311 RepID=A0A9W4SPU8_9GLOM|nr:14581_t:CDS:2 [Funneliformis geosporum]CAI2176113.1 13597_t:CDS:2 [Funneliformis geosporum]
MEYLFDESLISTEIQDLLPSNLKLRPLAKDDFNKGIFSCLEQLSIIGDVSQQKFVERFEELKNAYGYYIIVIEEKDQEKIVGLGTLFVEMKFLRNFGKAGHIEDIVVHISQRKMNLGRRIIEQLIHLGKELGCYKIILNCNEKNIPFYEKCGLALKDVQMTLYNEIRKEDLGVENFAPPKTDE